MEPGLQKDRLALVFLLAPLAKFYNGNDPAPKPRRTVTAGPVPPNEQASWMAEQRKAVEA